MSGYLLVIFVHIAAAVLLLSTSIVGEPAVRAAARRATQTRELQAYLRIGHPMVRLSLVSALLVLASGIYLSSGGGFWSAGWVQVALAFWLVNGFLAGLMVRPAIERVAEEASRAPDAAVTGTLDDLRWAAGWTRGVDMMAANDAAMLYLMSMKPSLGGSLVVVLLANLLVAGARQIAGVGQPAPVAIPATSHETPSDL